MNKIIERRATKTFSTDYHDHISYYALIVHDRPHSTQDFYFVHDRFQVALTVCFVSERERREIVEFYHFTELVYSIVAQFII